MLLARVLKSRVTTPKMFKNVRNRPPTFTLRPFLETRSSLWANFSSLLYSSPHNVDNCLSAHAEPGAHTGVHDFHVYYNIVRIINVYIIIVIDGLPIHRDGLLHVPCTCVSEGTFFPLHYTKCYLL